MPIIQDWLLVVNGLAVLLTVKDKCAAVGRHRRVRERTLLLIAVLGGGALLWLTMVLIRHKIRNPKFMVGVPAIVIAQITVGCALWWLLS